MKIKYIHFLYIVLLIFLSCVDYNNPYDPFEDASETDEDISVTGIILNKTSTSILVGGTEQLAATIEPADANNQNVTWSSNDEDVTTVSSSGLVYAVDGGTAIITVTTEDGGFTDGCEVTVIVPVTGVNLNKSTTTLDVGSSEQLTETITPADATNKNVSWSTSDAGKAIVSASGVVTAVGLDGGSATITAITEDGDFTANCTVTINPAPVYTADGVSFDMAYVSGKTFPIGANDPISATVTSPYWIGETEVTYELWSTVHTWATANGYYFANAGTEGDGSGDTDQHPVTTINWRDAMVWCNAATEWYNAKSGTSYTCVYTYDDGGGPEVIKDSRDSNDTACDGAVAGSSATGFRLLSSNEWELAARWRSDDTNTVTGYSNPWFTQGDSASGATADYNNSTATEAVAWYNINSGSSTHIVKTKTANSLGLYDLSGNVSEWCFDLLGTTRVNRGGKWNDNASNLQIGSEGGTSPYHESSYCGFRLARSD
jgi:sulfatase modifying factor 1